MEEIYGLLNLIDNSKLYNKKLYIIPNCKMSQKAYEFLYNKSLELKSKKIYFGESNFISELKTINKDNFFLIFEKLREILLHNKISLDEAAQLILEMCDTWLYFKDVLDSEKNMLYKSRFMENIELLLNVKKWDNYTENILYNMYFTIQYNFKFEIYDDFENYFTKINRQILLMEFGKESLIKSILLFNVIIANYEEIYKNSISTVWSVYMAELLRKFKKNLYNTEYTVLINNWLEIVDK